MTTGHGEPVEAPLCVKANDVLVSKSVRDGGLWERKVLTMVLKALSKLPSSVLIDGGELVLAAPGPELAAELLGEGGGSADHSLELALVHLAVKVLVSGDKSPKC